MTTDNEIVTDDDNTTTAGVGFEAVFPEIAEEIGKAIEAKMAKTGFSKTNLRRGLTAQIKKTKLQELDIGILSDELLFWKAVVRDGNTKSAIIGGVFGALVASLTCTLVWIGGLL